MTTVTIDIYKGSTLLGSGTINGGSGSVTSFSANLGRAVHQGRNITVHSRSGSPALNDHKTAANDQTWRTTVTADNGSTLTLAHMNPH